MSWITRVEGSVETVVAKIEEEAKAVLTSFEKDVHAFEVDLIGKIKAAFAAYPVEGKSLSVAVQSTGHFDDNGVGTAVVTIASKPVDAPAAETPPSAAPAEEAPKAG